MKAVEIEKPTWPKIKHTVNKELDKYHGQVLFPDKLEKANETIQRIGLPKGWGKADEVVSKVK